MIEPTETESLETLDAFVDAMLAIAEEAATRPRAAARARRTRRRCAGSTRRARSSSPTSRIGALPGLSRCRGAPLAARSSTARRDGRLEHGARPRALLASRAAGRVPPTLRLYRWARPTVDASAGSSRSTTWTRAACARDGVDVVRRPTGGRGVLHDDELTYSVVAAADDGVPRGVAAQLPAPRRGAARGVPRAGRATPSSRARPRGRGQRGAATCTRRRPTCRSAGAKLSAARRCGTATPCLQHGSLRRDARRRARGGASSACRRRERGGARARDRHDRRRARRATRARRARRRRRRAGSRGRSASSSSPGALTPAEEARRRAGLEPGALRLARAPTLASIPEATVHVEAATAKRRLAACGSIC